MRNSAEGCVSVRAWVASVVVTFSAWQLCVSAILSDRERQKTAVYLRISSPAKIYRSREDVDESTSLSILPDTHHPV